MIFLFPSQKNKPVFSGISWYLVVLADINQHKLVYILMVQKCFKKYWQELQIPIPINTTNYD